jgi:hypothetical protein
MVVRESVRLDVIADPAPPKAAHGSAGVVGTAPQSMEYVSACPPTSKPTNSSDPLRRGVVGPQVPLDAAGNGGRFGTVTVVVHDNRRVLSPAE